MRRLTQSLTQFTFDGRQSLKKTLEKAAMSLAATGEREEDKPRRSQLRSQRRPQRYWHAHGCAYCGAA